MEELSFSFLNEIKKKTIFSVNDFQVIFNTDLKTANNLENDDVLREYIRAVLHENLLKSSGIKNTDEITSIQRLDYLDVNKSYIALDIATSLNQGVEELHCLITEERICKEDPAPFEDPASWNQEVPNAPSGPLMRWSSDMTHLLIGIRGEMDSEFEKARYKFRLWEKVASLMNSKLANKVTAKDCDDKWRNIVATYRKNIDRVKCLGDNKVRWEYFDAMDNVLKGTKYLHTDWGHSIFDNSPTKCEVEEIINVNAFSTMEEVEIENDQLFQNSVISKTSSGDERIWSTEQCLTLLCWRYQAENKFIGSFDDQLLYWDQLTGLLNEKFLIDVGVEEVVFVWNQCNILYELNLEKLKSEGVDAVQWKYFAVMDEIRGGTKEISEICIPKPGDYLLADFHSICFQNSYSAADDLLCDTNSISFVADSSNRPMENSDNENNISSVSSGLLWTKDLVRVLISSKKSVDEDIQRQTIPRKKLWWSVVRKLRAQRHVKVTEESCEEKWLELERIYRKNLTKVRNHRVVNWPFFWEMRDCVNSSSTESVAQAAKKTHLDDELRFQSTSYQPLKSGSAGVDDDGSPDNAGVDNRNLAAAIRELQENQNKLLREIVDNQQKRIDELHQEQLSIKSLLVQLLKKLS